MQLVLSVGEKVLEKVTMDAKRVKNEDYLQAKKRLLLFKHQLTIIALKGEPFFYLQAGSKINERSKSLPRSRA